MSSETFNSRLQDQKKRTIRSFVRREGRITDAQRRALEALLPRFDVSAFTDSNDLQSCFDSAQPLCLEIGFGNGGALLQMAQAHPDWNFVGVEVYRPGVGKLLLGIDDAELANIRVSTLDAIEFLGDSVAEASVDALFVFFPDPWPKKKHLKRRLINKSFVELGVSRLKPGAILHIATDIDSYAEQVRELISDQTQLSPIEDVAAIPARPATKYELRGQRLGHRIHDFYYQKISRHRGA